MQCHKCGNILPEYAKFCARCGTKADEGFKITDMHYRDEHHSSVIEETHRYTPMNIPDIDYGIINDDKKTFTSPVEPKREDTLFYKPFNEPDMPVRSSYNPMSAPGTDELTTGVTGKISVNNTLGADFAEVTNSATSFDEYFNYVSNRDVYKKDTISEKPEIVGNMWWKSICRYVSLALLAIVALLITVSTFACLPDIAKGAKAVDFSIFVLYYILIWLIVPIDTLLAIVFGKRRKSLQIVISAQYIVVFLIVYIFDITLQRNTPVSTMFMDMIDVYIDYIWIYIALSAVAFVHAVADYFLDR